MSTVGLCDSPGIDTSTAWSPSTSGVSTVTLKRYNRHNVVDTLFECHLGIRHTQIDTVKVLIGEMTPVDYDELNL